MATAAPASAVADRYAVPSGGTTSGSCTVGLECTLEYAIESAGGGDTVHVAPGQYAVTSTIIGGNVHIVGAGADSTQLTGAADLGGPVLTVNNVTSVKNLRIESTSPYAALDLTGTGYGLEVYSATGGAMILGGGSDLSTSVVHTSAANATALRVTGGVLSNTVVRHSTVVATAVGSSAIDATGLLAAIAVESSIANGVAADVTGDLANPVDLSYSAWRLASSSSVTNGAGNYDGTATFVDAAAGDFQQTATSPTINIGDNYDATQYDFDGRPRTIGAGTDIGAYEFPITPSATTGASSAITASGASVRATTNPRSTDSQYWVEYGQSAALGQSTAAVAASGASDVASDVALTGLLPGTTYHYRTVASNDWGHTEGSTLTFDTLELPPTPVTGAPTGLTATAARLEGAVDRGGAATTARFEWGETASYGNLTAVEDLGDGTGEVALTGVLLTGLQPNTEYHYRVVATNSQGTRQSADRTFRTQTRAPVASVSAASGLSPSGVTLNGSVDPGGADTAWRFEYGVGDYGSTAAGGNLSGTSAQAVSRTLSGLLPGTTYQYRLAADNERGSAAATGTFTTEVAPPGGQTGTASSVDSQSATVSGTVNMGGGSGSYRVDYGKGAGYGQRTASVARAASTSDQSVSVGLSGLEPGTVYHYRVVALNAKGTAAGADATFTTSSGQPAAPASASDPVAEPSGDGSTQREPAAGEVQADGLAAPDPAPPVGRSANATPAGGTVTVRTPGSSRYVTLTEGAGIPVGSVVDATRGQVTITSAADHRGGTQSANFGGSEFKVLQKRAARPITDIVLTGAIRCGARPLAKGLDADIFAAARRKWSRRRLWGRGHGRFRTRGRRAAATVRGTHWLTEDRCDGTLVRVKRGLVAVRDHGRRKTVLVRAGKQYIAKSPRAARARGGKRRR